MSKGIKIVIMFVLGILIIALIIFLFYFRSSGDQGVVEPAQEAPQSDLPSSLPENIVKGGEVVEPDDAQDDALQFPVLSSAQRQEAELERMAFSFAERFGSYSSESNFQNLRDLEIFMTASMRGWVADLISKADAKGESLATKTTTKALSVRESSLDETSGVGSFLISTQRTKQDGEVYYQDILLNLEKIGDAWKVDGAYWK